MDKKNNNFRCGFVSIVGRPNVGKSTLLNYIVGEKIAIVSKIPQTTRHQIRGIYSSEKAQIIFLDTPGIHLAKDELDRYMNKSSLATLQDANCVIHLVDANKPVGEEEHMVVSHLKSVTAPIILGLNKIDLKGERVPQYINLWEEATGKSVTEMKDFTLLPLSAKTGFNIDKLLEIILGYLPVAPALYPKDEICDVPQKIAIADIIREKLFHLMHEEIPHSLTVIIEDMTYRSKKLVHIGALVLVERDSQKEIVIGKKGEVLKKVGTLARIELEALLESKVFLEIHVKTSKKWRDDNPILQELGYDI